MKYAVLLATAPALALCACQNAEEPAPDASASPTAEAVETAAAPAGAAAFTAGQPPSREFMVGIWGEGEACNQPIDFQAGGTIKGDGPTTWTIENGQLMMDDLFKINLKVVDASTMEAVPEGAPESEQKTLKRCG